MKIVSKCIYDMTLKGAHYLLSKAYQLIALLAVFCSNFFETQCYTHSILNEKDL